MKHFIYVSLLAAVVAAAAVEKAPVGKAEIIRYVTAFTGYDGSGPSQSFFDYAPDLSLDLMDNAIISAQGTGVWIFYNDANYVGDSCTAVGISELQNLDSTCAGQTSSIRYAGNPDGLNSDYFNLYENEYFSGEEFRFDDSSPTIGSLDQAVSSVIISGTSSWTFFTGLEFQGNGVCLTPDHHYSSDDGTVFDYAYVATMDDLGLPDDSIRSVLKVCLGERIVVGRKL